MGPRTPVQEIAGLDLDISPLGINCDTHKAEYLELENRCLIVYNIITTIQL